MVPKEHLAVSGHILVARSWEGATSIERVEARDTAKCPTVPKTAPPPLHNNKFITPRSRNPRLSSSRVQARYSVAV